MRIVAVETLRPAFQPNLCVVVLHTDDGVTGLGEAYYSAEAVEVYLHRAIAPILFDLDDPNPERVSRVLSPYVGYQGGGIEVRASGAVDIALWDLLGKRTGLPLAALLGGPVHDAVPVYNTCAGPGYVNSTSQQHSSNWGIGAARRYEDLDAFFTRPAALTTELISEGITGMKVWPFDRFAEQSRGNDITPGQLREAMWVIEQIRSVAGADQMALMIELHGLWNRPAVTRIARALADFEPFWIEDPLRADAMDAYTRLRDDVTVPIALGETAAGVRGFLPLLRAGIEFATVDVQWTGGITQARRIAAVADAFATPIAPHDCTGPITFAAVCQFTMSQPNAVIQETVRAFLRTWYPSVVDGLPEVAGGVMRTGPGPGLGISLSERLDASDVSRRTSRATD